MQNDLRNHRRTNPHHQSVLIVSMALFALFLPAYSGSLRVVAQQPDNSAVSDSARNSEELRGRDLISPLNLTPEQREKIRAIREQTKDERAAIGQRLRETNRALQDALEVDRPDEALVEQRLHDLASAQAAQMRMRVMTEVRIRRVLTPEQQALLRNMRIRAGELNNERPLMRRLRQREAIEGRRHRALDNDDANTLRRPEDKRRPHH
jgi:Spy/CpxP family protein refolding chaperone